MLVKISVSLLVVGLINLVTSVPWGFIIPLPYSGRIGGELTAPVAPYKRGSYFLPQPYNPQPIWQRGQTSGFRFPYIPQIQSNFFRNLRTGVNFGGKTKFGISRKISHPLGSFRVHGGADVDIGFHANVKAKSGIESHPKGPQGKN